MSGPRFVAWVGPYRYAADTLLSLAARVAAYDSTEPVDCYARHDAPAWPLALAAARAHRVALLRQIAEAEHQTREAHAAFMRNQSELTQIVLDSKTKEELVARFKVAADRGAALNDEANALIARREALHRELETLELGNEDA